MSTSAFDRTRKSTRELRQPLRVAYSPAEAAHVLGISRATLYRLIGEKLIKVRKAGARTLIAVDEVQAFMSGGAS